MKNLLSILLTVAALTGSANANAQDDWTNFKRYEKDNQTVRTLPQEQRKVVFMGNSITENWVRYHKDFFTENGYIGRGIGGQTTYQLALRFYEDVVKLHPKAVVINGGTNDIAQNNHTYVEERTLQNIITMAEMAKAYKIKVILTSITPTDHYRWRPDVTNVIEKIKSLNARIEAYTKKNKCLYVDYFSAMCDERGAMREGISEEGCHPNMEGYAIMEPLVQAAIRKVVK